MTTTSSIRRVVGAFLEREASHKYGCLYAPLPKKLADTIHAWGRDNVVDDVLFFFPEGDGGREKDIHVTVKYGFHSNDATALQRFITAHPMPLKATLGNVTTFDQKDHQVIKIDVVSEDLSRLHRMVTDEFETTDTHPVYIPHVTIAYVKAGNGSRYIGRGDFKNEPIEFDKLVFTGSDDRTTTINLG